MEIQESLKHGNFVDNHRNPVDNLWSQLCSLLVPVDNPHFMILGSTSFQRSFGRVFLCITIDIPTPPEEKEVIYK
jgi:hypothetical protein